MPPSRSSIGPRLTGTTSFSSARSSCCTATSTSICGEVLDHAKALPPAWLGKTAKMHLSDVETILETAPDISPNNALALSRIKEFRKLRNLLAHFAVKRFPTEDALVFVTKSAADYKRVLGAEPDPGVV